MPLDVAIVIGHHPDAPGAVLDVDDYRVSEYDYWTPAAAVLGRMLIGAGITPAIVRRPNPEPDEALAKAVNATGARCAVELHFNSVGDPDAHGSEMLYWGDSWAGKQLADLLLDRTTYAIGTRRRGLRPKYSGWPFLQLTDMPAVICEPAFASNPAGARRLLAEGDKILRAYGNAIADFLQ